MHNRPVLKTSRRKQVNRIVFRIDIQALAVIRHTLPPDEFCVDLHQDERSRTQITNSGALIGGRRRLRPERGTGCQNGFYGRSPLIWFGNSGTVDRPILLCLSHKDEKTSMKAFLLAGYLTCPIIPGHCVPLPDSGMFYDENGGSLAPPRRAGT